MIKYFKFLRLLQTQLFICVVRVGDRVDIAKLLVRVSMDFLLNIVYEFAVLTGRNRLSARHSWIGLSDEKGKEGDRRMRNLKETLLQSFIFL